MKYSHNVDQHVNLLGNYILGTTCSLTNLHHFYHPLIPITVMHTRPNTLYSTRITVRPAQASQAQPRPAKTSPQAKPSQARTVHGTPRPGQSSSKVHSPRFTAKPRSRRQAKDHGQGPRSQGKAQGPGQGTRPWPMNRTRSRSRSRQAQDKHSQARDTRTRDHGQGQGHEPRAQGPRGKRQRPRHGQRSHARRNRTKPDEQAETAHRVSERRSAQKGSRSESVTDESGRPKGHSPCRS